MEWEQCWLKYRALDGYEDAGSFENLCYNSGDPRVESAAAEIQYAFSIMLNIDVKVYKAEKLSAKNGIYLNVESSRQYSELYGEEGFEIKHDGQAISICAYTGAGILYGSFALLRKMSMGIAVRHMTGIERPDNPLRMLNHWDNMDGTIERGYSGQSFFFKENEILIDERTKDYARLASSVGINAVVINNVNVAGEAVHLITSRYFNQLSQLTDIFNKYGIRLFLSLDFAAPIDIGGLKTADPLCKEVQKWWDEKMQAVFNAVPNLGGFIIKADSEGRPGPFTYNRSHADGANMLARAVKPYGGIIIWRCFVYNCQQDWRDKTTDRARAGYDNFSPLDGQFDDTVILQIKNGPMDFQVREPVSPLIGAMKNTNQMLEFQIAQEYTGQQKHVCYLIPMMKEVLEFDTYCCKESSKAADIISGRTYGNTICGITAVANTGDSTNWTGHDLAAANLYGYGRLAWDTHLNAEQIAGEWIMLTYSCNTKVVKALLDILMASWLAYEKYTSPLGIGWMVNPNHHYGPNVDGYEYDRWGTYHRADFMGIGVDRSGNGTGYVNQYFEPNRSIYNTPAKCPEELLLFFHHVSYQHMLSSNKTVIQHIYDTHFEGVEDVEEMIIKWKSIKGLIDGTLHQRTLEKLEYQLEHSKQWRDVINTYFYRKTGIKDELNRKIYT